MLRRRDEVTTLSAMPLSSVETIRNSRLTPVFRLDFEIVAGLFKDAVYSSLQTLRLLDQTLDNTS